MDSIPQDTEEIFLVEGIEYALEFGVALIEGVAAIVIVVSFFWVITQYFASWSKTSREEGFHQLRGQLGRALLVALEILVVADVIETILTEVTFEALAVLALLVLLRTLVSWSLALQVEGKWPWQPEPEKEADHG